MPTDDLPTGYDRRSDRPTPPGMGQTRHPSGRELAGGLLAARQAPDVDDRRSAALERWLTERFGRTVRLAGTATADANGQAIVDAGGPQAGFTWNVRRVNVGPVDYAAGSFPTATVIAAITGQGAGVPTSAGQVLSMTAAYPAEGTWGMGEATLLEGDRLRIIITGLTAGDTVTAGGQAIETAAGVPEIYGL